MAEINESSTSAKTASSFKFVNARTEIDLAKTYFKN